MFIFGTAMHAFFSLQEYIKYLLKARGRHGIHSPFVFKLAGQLMNSRSKPTEYKEISRMFTDGCRSQRLIPQMDFGTGAGERTLGEIIKKTALPRKYGLLLYRLAAYFRPTHILELGSGAGFSTMYLACGNDSARIVGMEGNPALCEIAGEHLRGLGVGNVEILQGNFDALLPEALQQMERLDFAFIDGNHRKTATLEYFKLLLDVSGDDTLLVFDDIHWSRGMADAWQAIAAHPRVTLTIDLFRMGLVFFRQGLSKQQLTIRY